jgi:hypothetical protein
VAGLEGSSSTEIVSRGAEYNLSNPPDIRRFFLMSKAMEAEEHDAGLRPIFVCAGCGDELILTLSGHKLCANRRCEEGFDVGPDRRMVALRVT